MKRWADFERDRRYRSGMQSRDSTYDIIHQRNGSPNRAGSTRFSMISSVDTYNSGGGGSHLIGEALFRQSSPGISASIAHSDIDTGFYNGHKYPTQLELPAPLSAIGSDSSLASIIDYEQSQETPLPRLPREGVISYEYPRYGYAEGYDSDELEREAILGNDSPIIKQSPTLESGSEFLTSSSSGFSHAESPIEGPEILLPSLNSASSSSNESIHSGSVSAHSSTKNPNNPFNGTAVPARQRGVSLVDPGAVAGPGGMREVRRSRRFSQTTPTTSSSSRSRTDSSTHPPPIPDNSSTSTGNGTSGSLPPGAAY